MPRALAVSDRRLQSPESFQRLCRHEAVPDGEALDTRDQFAGILPEGTIKRMQPLLLRRGHVAAPSQCRTGGHVAETEKDLFRPQQQIQRRPGLHGSEARDRIRTFLRSKGYGVKG